MNWLIRQQRIPIIFITAQRDEMLRPRLLKLGAVECLLKPFNEADLLEAIKMTLQEITRRVACSMERPVNIFVY